MVNEREQNPAHGYLGNPSIEDVVSVWLFIVIGCGGWCGIEYDDYRSLFADVLNYRPRRP